MLSSFRLFSTFALIYFPAPLATPGVIQPAVVTWSATAYLNDPDHKGTNVRRSADAKSAIASTITNADSQIEITGSLGEWLRIREVRLVEGTATFKGEGWVYAPLFVTALAAPQSMHAQSTVPRAVMQQLAKQLRNDVPAMRDCETKSEFNFSARAQDLNGDKQPEYLLTSASACECGQVNCSQWVYRAHNSTFELLLEAQGYLLATAATSHMGYRDLKTTARDNAVIVDHMSYTFNGKRYEQSSSTIENLDTHEIKPTQQRIRFANGASEATVRGSALLAFPDSWTFDAKHRQTLTLNLQHTAGTEATFTLVGPGANGDRMLTDLQVKWSDRLPMDGTYTILVNAKGDGRANYTLTIGIR